MKRTMMLLVCLVPLVSGCGFTLPRVHTLEVGELREEKREILRDGAESAEVRILFGAGELEIAPGEEETLFAGIFRYNVEEWAPEVSYEDGELRVEQGHTENAWGIPDDEVRNDWELKFSPAVDLDLDLKVGACRGELDLSGLRLTKLDLDVGASELDIRFTAPNPVAMERLTLDAGASDLKVIGLGNAGPRRLSVKGGVGSLTLDFTGAWPASARVEIDAGVSTLTLRLPDDVGVRVEVEGGLSDVEAEGLRRSGDAYVNDRYGEAETELLIEIRLGVGSLKLVEVESQ